MLNNSSCRAAARRTLPFATPARCWLAAAAAVVAGTPVAHAAAPVTAVTTYSAPSGPTASYTTTSTGGSAATLNFNGAIRRLASVSTAGGTKYYLSRGVIDAVVHRHPVNPAPLDQRINLRFETAAAPAGSTYNLAAPYVDTVEAALRSAAVNVGVDNTFVNVNGMNSQTSSIERVDIRFAPLANVSATQLTSVVVPIFDRDSSPGGSDLFRISVLRADATGSCAAPLVGTQINSASSGALLSAGGSDAILIARRDPPSENKMRPATTRTQSLTGQVFTLAELGVNVGDTVCGVALFGRDSRGVNPRDASMNPTNTPDGQQGGLDLVAATGLFDLDAAPGEPRPPVAQDDAPTAAFTPGNPAQVNVLNGGAAGLGADTDPNSNLDPASVVFVNPPSGGSTLSNGGKTLTVPGQGVWTVDAAGVVTFTPAAGFTGNPTLVQYTVSDLTALVSNPATITLNYQVPPNAVNDTLTNQPVGNPITLKVTDNDTDANGNATVDPATVVFVNPPSGATLSADSKTLTVPNQGTWTVAVDGTVTFTPLGTFRGNPTPVQYTVADTTGLTSTPATITFTITASSPVANPDVMPAGIAGQPVSFNVLSNDVDAEQNIDPASVVFVNPPAGATLSADSKTLTVPNQGTWTVAVDGTVTFTPVPGFAGVPTPVQYTVRDVTGQVSNAATITKPAAAAASAVAAVPVGPWAPLSALVLLATWAGARRRRRQA